MAVCPPMDVSSPPEALAPPPEELTKSPRGGDAISMMPANAGVDMAVAARKPRVVRIRFSSPCLDPRQELEHGKCTRILEETRAILWGIWPQGCREVETGTYRYVP